MFCRNKFPPIARSSNRKEGSLRQGIIIQIDHDDGDDGDDDVFALIENDEDSYDFVMVTEHE